MTGRLFNETGQMEDWWTEQSVQNFVERQQCFIDQYNNYTLFGLHVSLVPIAYNEEEFDKSTMCMMWAILFP